jgi:2-polyprenyl-6-methoxyphenol hydroxylase-like FAD-dependent oxidoreductase
MTPDHDSGSLDYRSLAKPTKVGPHEGTGPVKALLVGGGVAGLSAAMLLAHDGHDVTVLERDAPPPPADADSAWADWDRRGVNQFRMLHYFQPRFRELMTAELPLVIEAFDAGGALRFNPVAGAPAEMTGGVRDGDERFEAITGRRPVMESAIARVAEATPQVDIRRGVAVGGLITGTEALAGVPHVVGVETEDGERLFADLVVDATGRRSPLPRWLSTAGARPGEEETDDSGFVYYGRHFRSADGSLPPVMAPLLSHYGSVSILTLPADNGTWGVGFTTCASDAELRKLRDLDRWNAAIELFPLIAHWSDGEPISEGVAVMAKIEDRIRRFVVDGTPVATGVISLGDSWACTNPSVGRGATIGLMHAVELRDLLRRTTTGDPAAFALAWDDATMTTVEPWYRATLQYDRHRLAEADAATRGEPYEPGDISWEMTRGLLYGAGQDPDLFRSALRIAGLLNTTEEVFGAPGIADKVVTIGAGWRDEPLFGPSRKDLVAATAG